MVPVLRLLTLFTRVLCFIHWVIHSHISAFIQSLDTDLLTNLSIRQGIFIHSFIHHLLNLYIHSLIHPCIFAFIDSFTILLILAILKNFFLIHSRNQFFSYWLIDSFTQTLICWFINLISGKKKMNNHLGFLPNFWYVNLLTQFCILSFDYLLCIHPLIHLFMEMLLRISKFLLASSHCSLDQWSIFLHAFPNFFISTQ